MQHWLYRHDEVITPRPYAFDVDEDDWLWEGCGVNRLTGHNLRTAELRQIPVPEMGGRTIYSAFAWQGKLVLVLGIAPFYLVCDPSNGTCVRKAIPPVGDSGTGPVIWYGTQACDGQKLLLYDRSTSRTLILDAPDADPRVVEFPYRGQLATGREHADGLIYSGLDEPARIVCFDPVGERFVDEITGPDADQPISPQHLHNGVLYCTSSSQGRIHPFDLTSRRWLEPILTPDHGDVYGFLGGAFSFQGKLFACLSTYAHPSRLDLRTGKVIVPEGPLTVDGRPPRFLDRFLVFDPETRAFDYLTAPSQPDGVPLLCYSWTDGERFAITGMVIPYNEPGVPGELRGHWIVLQSVPADGESGFLGYDLNFDRTSHLADYRRTYPRARSVYLSEEPHTPPIVNMQGSATPYLPGREAELKRRVDRTDSDAYLRELAGDVTAGAEEDADRVRRVTGFVQRSLYYNPVQVTGLQDPVAILEAHDARCGQGVTVTLALLEALGIPCRRTDLFHHTVAEARYNGTWHIADALFFGADQPAREGCVLSVEDLKADPYFADRYPQDCFSYDPEQLTSEDGFWIEGYVFGCWGSEPYYSYYLGCPKEHPPTLPAAIPAQRAGRDAVRLNWSRSIKLGGGQVEYAVRVFRDRACREQVFEAVTQETSVEFAVEEPNRMYFVEVRAMDDHRKVQPETWYPAARSNFVLVPEEQYGWYGVL